MDLRKLAHFVEVAENGSFTRAAGHLAMAQSALSRQIRELEDELGVPLLHRNGRGATLTEAGELFLPRAKKLLSEAEMLVSDMRSLGAVASGVVTLGVPPSVSHILLAPLLDRIARELPGVHMRVIEGFSGHIHEWLLNGRIDLAVLYNARTSATLASDRLLAEDMFLIGPAGDSVTATSSIRLTDIAKLPLLLPCRPHGLRILVDAACAAAGVKLSVTIEVDALATMKNLVRAGTIRTILPLAAVVEELESGTLSAAHIVEPVISRELLLASSNQRPSSRATREVAGILRQQVADLVQAGRWPTMANLARFVPRRDVPANAV